MAEEDAGETKPKVEAAEVINLVVRDQQQTEVHFKVKKHTKFEKIFVAYCSKKGLDKKAVKFLFDGMRLNEDQTPQQCDMEDGDNIDSVIEQIGGRL